MKLVYFMLFNEAFWIMTGCDQFLSSRSVPDVAYMGQQHGEVSKPQSLLLCRQTQFGNGPDQSIDDMVQKAKQLVPALQLFWCLRGACAQIYMT